MTAENASAVCAYQRLLKEARSLHEKTIDSVLRQIWQFERFGNEMDFQAVKEDDIARFKASFTKGGADVDKGALSASMIIYCLGDLNAFFAWLSNHQGYRSIDRGFQTLESIHQSPF